jgi:hypothetical protein
MALKKSGASIEVGVTCALCHSTVDAQTGKVVHGAVNADLNSGLLMAMASNTAAFFPHAEIPSLEHFVSERSNTVRASDGRPVKLPDPQRLEDAVDATLLQWPPGSFDSMVDLVGAPSQLPDSFTYEDYPFSWSGAFMAGPFHGLSVQNNNVHALNSDTFVHTDSSRDLFGIDKEVYLATLLQHAASRRFRFDPNVDGVPSAFFAAVDPTPGTPAMNQVVPLPGYPKPSLVAADGLWSTRPGERVWERVNAMSAWQNVLVPPPAPIQAAAETRALGKAVFARAGCASCHSGPGFTNHRIVPVAEIGTEPSRARALQRMGDLLVPPRALSFEQTTPLSRPPREVAVPVSALDPGQIQLAFAQRGSSGGYKVSGLLGLYWSAPYLHDGGVAVGPNAERQLGIPGTSLQRIPPDPSQSLRALVDRNLRARVISANDGNSDLRAVHVRGAGHEFWVDPEAGFGAEEQHALIVYLLTLERG